MKKLYLILSIFLLVACSSRPSTNPSRPPSGGSTGANSPSRVWFPLLGSKEPQPLKRTPKHQILYQSNGFDRFRPKKLTQGLAYLSSKGATHLMDQLTSIANEVDNIDDYIDSAYDKNKKQYEDCGGKFLQFIQRHDPKTIYVEVVDIPIYSAASKLWAGGMALRDNKTIKVVVVTVGGIETNPKTADLRQFKAYIPWEIGNLLMLRYGFVPKRIPDDEWGDKSPCSQRQN